RCRYDSAMGERTSLTIASAVVSEGADAAGPPRRRFSDRAAGISANEGKLIYRLMSSTDLIESSKKSSRKARPMPATNESTSAIIIIRMRWGPTGAWGNRLGFEIDTLVPPTPETALSSRRFAKRVLRYC